MQFVTGPGDGPEAKAEVQRKGAKGAKKRREEHLQVLRHPAGKGRLISDRDPPLSFAPFAPLR
ncbi:MAG: hypothetical protein JNL89_10975 [Rhodanobacteraceae bacterium]|nr:hypothetical protein [Rhodanobacteraceae bacterium]